MSRKNKGNREKKVQLNTNEFLAEEQMSEEQIIACHRTELFSGPIPHPDVLMKYDKQTRDTIVKMANQQSKHRQDLESSVVKSNIKHEGVGMFLAFFLTLFLVLCGLILCLSGQGNLLTNYALIIAPILAQFLNYLNEKKKQTVSDSKKKQSEASKSDGKKSEGLSAKKISSKKD